MPARTCHHQCCRAFDTEEGLEVAWNQVELIGLEMEHEVRSSWAGARDLHRQQPQPPQWR